MFTPYKDRRAAGVALAKELTNYAGQKDVIVLALPRGGVPVAFEVAKSLGLPLDVLVVRKLGVPGQEELAFGAVASGGAMFLNDGIVNALRMPDTLIETIAGREKIELQRREHLYRGDRPSGDVRGKTVIIVDDGLATGATMRVAIRALKQQRPKMIVVAVPVAARETCEEIKQEADVLCVCAKTPRPFYAVGIWFDVFDQTTDQEVRELIEHANAGKHEVTQAA